MEKININNDEQPSTCVETNFYSNFIIQNFSSYFSNDYVSKDKEEIKRDFYKILGKGISSFENYSEINLGYLDFTNDNQYSDMLDSLNENSIVESLLFASNPNMNQNDLSKLLESFSKIKSFKNLYIYNSALQGNLLAESTSSVLKKDILNTLHLSTDNLQDLGLSIISQNLHQNKLLTNLTLTNVNISSNSFSSLAKIVEECSNLSFLSISDTNLNIERDTNFTFSPNYEIEKIDLSTSFLKALSKNTSLTHLSFVNCFLGREAVYILQALENNSNNRLRLLDFTENNIQSRDFQAILQSLRKVKIHYLTLNQNNIGDLGIFYLYDYLEETVSSCEERCQFLELEQNNITDKGAKNLCNIIDSDFFYLKMLNLKFNLLSSLMVTKVADALVDYSMRTEKRLDIEKSGLNNIFKVLNISQIGIDVSKNSNLDEEEYDNLFRKKIKAEYSRFFKN